MGVGVKQEARSSVVSIIRMVDTWKQSKPLLSDSHLGAVVKFLCCQLMLETLAENKESGNLRKRNEHNKRPDNSVKEVALYFFQE